MRLMSCLLICLFLFSCSGESAESAYSKLQELKKGTDLNKIYDQYQLIYRKYKESEFAEEALFYIGYMNHNNFQQLDSAKKYFNLFIKEFPKSELVESAKFELNNLGIPANELPFMKDKNGELVKKPGKKK